MFTFKGTCDLAEAFRDKSEGSVADAFYRASGVEGTKYDVAGTKWTPADLFDAAKAGLREEIERLRREGKRVDADADKWMGRAAVAETKLEAAEAEVAALRERERWIPVGEKLPPHVGYYLVVQANSVSPATVAYYSGSGKIWSYADVTHWKALSAAPEPRKDAK